MVHLICENSEYLSSKGITKKAKRQAREWKKLFAIYIKNKTHIQCQLKKKTTQMKIEQYTEEEKQM